MNNNYLDTTSYTNKDFRAIWPELLELVTDLTDKWDPNNSNEADPGVALLKLQAFVADKLNYNIDKNTLETFPSSVTQRGNAQKLYDSLGYQMKWYQSAKTDVHFKFINPNTDDILPEDVGTIIFTIPRFAQICDAEHTIVYTTLNSAVIDNQDNKQTQQSIEVIEGPIQSFLINGSDRITINNLDSDYRLYFRESMIASNGIFINNIDSEELWESTFNLESTQLSKKVFKFGVLPTTNQCYIEFPQDAAELFEEGINIKYIISSGVKGNISPKYLTTFNQDYPEGGVDAAGNNYALNTYVKVLNENGANSGQDPESLESAYKNYQKTVNTFSTLVTLDDYKNALYNSDKISNVLVTDRLTDFNNSYIVKTKNLIGESEDILTHPNGLQMKAFNLAIYPLNKIKNVYNAETYAETFNTSLEARYVCEDVIEDCKAIQHDFIDLQSNNNLLAYMFKNLISISGQIITYQKVSTTEASQIIKKIKETLYKTYESKNIDFGQDLSLDDLIKTVKSADSRIKEFIPDDSDYNTVVMQADNSYLPLLQQSADISLTQKIENLQKEILARSILAGVTPLFIFDTDTAYSYTMHDIGSYNLKLKSDGSTSNKSDIYYNSAEEKLYLPETPTPSTDSINSKYTNISAITTQVDIPLTASGYTIKPNEQVFFYAPSYISKAQISTYLNICLVSSDTTEIPKDSLYKLKAGEKLYVSEAVLTDPDNNDLYATNNKYIPADEDEAQIEIKDKGKAYKVYEAGTIIKSSFKLTKENKGGIQSPGNKLSYYVNLESSKTIDIMDSNSTRINKKSIDDSDTTTKQIYCAWITNDLNNYLFTESDINAAQGSASIEHILQQNELFMYTDSTKSDLILLQSGTRLKISSYNENNFSKDYWKMAKPSASRINQEGLESLNDYWKEIPRNLRYFEVEELEIKTLGAGVKLIDIDTSDNNPKTLNNIPVIIEDPTKIKWYYDNEEVSLPSMLLGDDNNSWKAFSRLSLLVSPEHACTLSQNQSLCLFSLDNDSNNNSYYTPKYVLGPGQSFTTDHIMILSGGIKQDSRVLKADETLEPISLAVFKYEDLTNSDNTNNIWDIDITTISDSDKVNLDNINNNISVNVTSDSVYQTTLEISEDNIKSITLSMPLSKLFNSTDSTNSGTLIPVIVQIPQNNKLSFNLSTCDYDKTLGYGIQAGDEFDPTPYHNTLLCLNYVDEDKLSLTITSSTGKIKVDSKMIITMFKPMKYLGINNYTNITTTYTYYLIGEDSKSISLIDLRELNGWDADKSYSKDAIVTHLGNTYISKIDKNKGREPTPNDNNNWKLLTISDDPYNSINQYNPYTLVRVGSIESIKNKIVELSAKTFDGSNQSKKLSIFDFSYQCDENNSILNPLDPLSFYDQNHICNKMTLSQIKAIDIRVARQSKQ